MIISVRMLLVMTIVSDKYAKKIETRIFCSETLFKKFCLFCEIFLDKFGTAEQATDNNIIRLDT
jgi:hypothetical protein